VEVDAKIHRGAKFKLDFGKFKLGKIKIKF